MQQQTKQEGISKHKHFPESMKKPSVTGRVQGEEAPRVSWGRTGYTRQ